MYNVVSSPATISLEPGEARIYTDVLLPDPGSELVPYLTPLAPDLTSAVEVPNVINLIWIDHSTIETGYTVYRRKSGESFEAVDQLPINTEAYASYGLLPLTTYDFYVEAANPYANSPSQILTVTTSDLITAIADQPVPLRIYPNPTEGTLQIDLPPGGGRVEFRNSMGQLVTYQTPAPGLYDLSGVPAGLYLVTVESDGKLTMSKVVVR